MQIQRLNGPLWVPMEHGCQVKFSKEYLPISGPSNTAINDHLGQVAGATVHQTDPLHPG